MRKNPFVLGGTFAAALLASTGVAHAQDDSDEVIVTAQSRTTRLETTPLPISVLSGELLEERGVVELKQLSATVPGLTMNESPGGIPGVSVRGIGSSPANQMLEQSIGLFVDGVYHPRSRQYRDAMHDVERLEVVKGSQGVLFGKNTAIGAVSITSRRPGDILAGHISYANELEIGGDMLTGAVDVPLSDTFRVRLSGLYSVEDGWVENGFLNTDSPRTERYLLRSVFDWDITDNLNAILKLQTSDYDIDGNAFEPLRVINPATLTSRGVLDGGQGQFIQYTNETYDRLTATDNALILTYDFANGGALVATTGYSEFDYSALFDTDLTPLPLQNTPYAEDYRSVSQEARYISPSGGAFEYVIGAAYTRSWTEVNNRNIYLNQPQGANRLTGTLQNSIDVDDETFSVFGQVNWNITDRLTWQIGGRQNHQVKEADFVKTTNNGGDAAPQNRFNLAAPLSSISGEISEDSFDYATTLSFDLTDSAIVYANFGRGNKAGAFNNTTPTLAPLPTPFIMPHEETTTYEVGVKGRFFDRRLYLSLSAYHVEVEGFQDAYFDGLLGGFTIRSIDIETEGFELEGNLRATDWLQFYGAASYLPTAEVTDAPTLAVIGQRLQRAPERTYSIGARTDFDLGNDFGLSTDVNYQQIDSFYNQAPNASPVGQNVTGDISLLNARIALATPGGVEISLQGRNLTDEQFISYSFAGTLDAGGLYGAFNQPRTVWLGVRKEF